jgi:hypothetical protein
MDPIEQRHHLKEGIKSESFGVVMIWLNEMSNEMQQRYDGIDISTNPSAFYRIQAYREIINVVIPAKMEAVLNSDVHPTDQRWSFRGWLISVARNVSGKKGSTE